MAAKSTFSIELAERDGVDIVILAGVIDENADLSVLATLGRRPVRFHMRGVRRINSYGVRSWVDAIRSIPGDAKLTFIHVPPPVIDQCNMVSGFLGRGMLESFYAPMRCAECDETIDRLFQAEACRAIGGRLPQTPCPKCGRPMEVDDLEEQYLLFLRDG